jgi:spore coat polysaccharide biosynthesis protein SpsF
MIAAIVQARMGSTRLPGKVMKPLCEKPILWHVVTRLKYSNRLENIVVATTDREEDKVCARLMEEMSVDIHFDQQQMCSTDIIRRQIHLKSII